MTSANPARYLPSFGARWQLPPNQGSPIAKVHYEVVNAAGEVVVPEQTFSATNPTELRRIEGPAQARRLPPAGLARGRSRLQRPGDHRADPPRHHAARRPAGPLGDRAGTTSRAAEGFDLRWHNIVDTGSPIDAVHYQVLDGSGSVVVPTKTVSGEDVQAIAEPGNAQRPRQLHPAPLAHRRRGQRRRPRSAPPLAYDCVRSEVAGGTHLSAGFGGAGSEDGGAGQRLDPQRQPAAASAKGIAGAPLCVFSHVVTDPGREFLGIAITDAAGDYRFADPSRAPRATSASSTAPTSASCSAEATLMTVVHPTFQIARKVVHNKHVARFSGEIPGPHNDQVVVVLQVRSGKGWRAFRRYRTREGGRFSVGYRFTRTVSPTRYVMRAQVRETAGYPYLQGNSPLLYLRVLPDRHLRRASRRR